MSKAVYVKCTVVSRLLWVFTYTNENICMYSHFVLHIIYIYIL